MERTYNRKLRSTLLIFILIPFIIASFIFMGMCVKDVYRKTDDKITECCDKFTDRVNEYAGTCMQRVRFITYFSGMNSCLMNRTENVVDGSTININNNINDVFGAMLADNDLSEISILTSNKNATPLSVVWVVEQSEIDSLCIPDEELLWVLDGEDVYSNLCMYKKYSLIPGCDNVIKIKIPLSQLLKSFSSSDLGIIQVNLMFGNGKEINFGIRDGKLTSEEIKGKTYKKDFELSNINASFSVYTDYSYITNKILRLCLIYMALVVFLLAVAFVITRTVSERTTSELNNIIKALGQSDAESIKKLNVKNKEFKIIQSYLSDMTERIKRENNEKIELETKVLSQRITPHFIYNNLSAIKSTSTDRFTRGAVDKFVKYCRNIFSNQSKFITLNDEIRNSEEYLDLLKFCYAFEFEVITDIEEDCRDIIVPINIMQPLLENAFIHGINRMPDDFEGVIRLGARHDGEFLYITVSDNAGTFEGEEKSKKLHALDILRRLIDVYYKNEQCGITLRKENKETIAEIKIEVKYEIEDSFS